MRRPDPARLDEVTSVAETWLRRCNGKPTQGMPVGRSNLRAVLATSTNVAVDKNNVIAWVVAGMPFTAEPARDDVQDHSLPQVGNTTAE